MRKYVIGGLIAAALIAAGAAARAADQIMIEEPWAPSTIGRSTTGAAYMTIVNHGEANDRLVGASSPVAGKVELHESVVQGGVARMRAVPAMELKPHEPVALRPGGLHLMMTGLKAPLKAGAKIPLTLQFEKSGAVETTVSVGPAPAAGHGGMTMPGMGH